MAGDLPSAVLFACTQNVIRSVMAAAIMKHFYGQRVYVASCGVRPGTPDPFVTSVMDEMGIDLGRHRPQGFEGLAQLAGVGPYLFGSPAATARPYR